MRRCSFRPGRSGGQPVKRAATLRPLALCSLALCSLLLAVFVVYFGYSAVLPILPALVERTGVGLDAKIVSIHTGLASSLYAFALFLFAPVWGWLSDRGSRSFVLILGLFGYGFSLIGVVALGGIVGLYIERLSSGVFAEAISRWRPR